MNNLNLILRPLFLLVFWLFTLPAESQSLEILTYNIRYDNAGDGINSWANRRNWLCQQISQVNPEIFNIQEGLVNQVNYIDSMFSGYRHVGVGRDDGKYKGEFCAIFYNAKKLKVLKQATFWLSPTPGKVSMGWDAACIRICTYGLFRDLRSGKKFWVFNTHFDHVGVLARKNSALLILEKIKALNKHSYPVILTGDLNSIPGSEVFRIICEQLQDSQLADKSMSMSPDGTYNGFEISEPATERIDFIFAGYGAIAVNYNVIREIRDGHYASDHFPVVAGIKFK
jgi:endonuclease/exonuclease/phosphatase family metal-dependent hydrolase